MRVNLGCGDELLDGFVNVDLRTDCGAQVVADVARPCFAPGSVEVIAAFDLLEHFPDNRTCRILRAWWEALADGGVLFLRVPNLVGLSRAIVDEVRPRRQLIRNIYGGHRWGPDGAWDTHHTGWGPDDLADVLRTCGFEVLENDHALNMTVQARKVAA